MCQNTHISKSNNKTRVACGIIVSSLLIVGAYVFIPKVWFWIGLEVIGAVLVAVGCIGEWRLLSTPHDEKHEKLEKLYAIVVAAGVTLDLVSLVHGIPEAIRLENDVATANERATSNEWQIGVLSNQTVRLSLDLAQAQSNNLVLRSNIVALEEQTQPRSIEFSGPAARLKKFAGTKAVIICAMGGDCPRAANQIGFILLESGVKTAAFW